MRTSTHREKKGSKPMRRITSKAKKRTPSKGSKDDSKLKDILQQVAEAAYVVASKTGFRGTFIHFLGELNEALESIIQRDFTKGKEKLH